MFVFTLFPFTLAGPPFLLFYAAFAAAVLLGWRAWLRRSGTGAKANAGIESLAGDPYRIACLRAGPEEATRLAVVNLVDRGLLTEAKAGHYRTTLDADPALQRRALDRALLASCRSSPMTPDQMLATVPVRLEAKRLDASLHDDGLLLSDDQHLERRRPLIWVILALGGVAGLRVTQAAMAGRTNVGILIAMAVLAIFAAALMRPQRLTARGRSALQSLQALTARLHSRAAQFQAGGASTEAVLCAAVFGLAVLPAAAFPIVAQAFPQPRPDRNSSDSGGGSSSCGSSSDSGGSCGGGGGGCGGCGGGD